jgi:hypothetical protein
MPIFPHQLNFLGATDRLRVANIHQSQRSRVQILTGAIYQNKLQPTPISRLRPTGVAGEGKC